MFKRLKYFTVLAIATALLSLWGCINHGAFFPPETNSISQIRFQGYLLQYPQNGKIKQMVRVRIRDKNDDLIAIEGGAVYFQGRKMPFENYLFNTPQYELIDYHKALFAPDSTYQITLMLPDSSRYDFYIRTPEKDLVEFNAPASIDSGQSFDISWREVCAHNPTRVELEFFASRNDSALDIRKFLPVYRPAVGRYRIWWSNFADFKGIRQIHLTLYYETEGSVDQRLLDNSYLRCQFTMKRTVDINR